MLELANIHKSFGANQVLEDINLTVAKGEVFGFLGPNGSGKTTTIRIILGLIYPDQGTVNINGFNINKEFYKAIASVGAVVESPKFYSQLTGYQNVLLIANLHPHVPKKKVQEVLEIVGLAKRAGDKVSTYSLGMKQRLGIARALINDPQLVFLDEPMNGLDPQGMLEMRELIRELAATKKITFFITSHLLHEIEQVCNKVAIIKTGKVLAQGKVDELLCQEREVVEVHTNAVFKAYQLLKSVNFVRSISTTQHKLVVELEKGFSSHITKLLVEQNIAVEYLIPQKQSLEDYFIMLTNGGRSVD